MKSTLKSSRRPLNPAQVVDEIRLQIGAGTLKPGDRLLSYNEMRDQYGVHSVAVQRVYAQLASDGLIVREKGRGTFVSGLLGNLPSPEPFHEPTVTPEVPRATRTGIIGVAGKGFAFKEYSPYWVTLLGGIREICDEAGHQILLLDFRSNKGWEKADGILLCDWSNDLTKQWLPPQMPCVSVLVPCDNVVSVYADDYSGGRGATEHLLGLGHRRIAYLRSADAFVSGRRYAGYSDALRAAGIQANAQWNRQLDGQFDYGARFTQRGREAMRRWLRTGWDTLGCTAILTQNDETATGVIEALREEGLSVPTDVSVIGFDGVVPPEFGSQRLTTMSVPLEEIGKTAMQMLLRQMEGVAVGQQHRVFSIPLRPGQSTAPLYTSGT